MWLKQAHAGPSGELATHAEVLARDLRAIVRIAAERYPNLRQVFLSPRTYAGYATTRLNPEPYAYESAFAVRRLVLDSVRDPGARPWLGWGPYLWTDGTQGRSDGFVWTCADVREDGTHPSASGQQKVAQLLQTFFRESPFAEWYRPAETVQGAQGEYAVQRSGEDHDRALSEVSALGIAIATIVGLASALLIRYARR